MNTTQAPAVLNAAQALAVAGFDISNLSAPAARVTFDVPVIFDGKRSINHSLVA